MARGRGDTSVSANGPTWASRPTSTVRRRPRGAACAGAPMRY